MTESLTTLVIEKIEGALGVPHYDFSFIIAHLLTLGHFAKFYVLGPIGLLIKFNRNYYCISYIV